MACDAGLVPLTLVEFILARYDERERAARDALLGFPTDAAQQGMERPLEPNELGKATLRERWFSRYHRVVQADAWPPSREPTPVADCGDANVYPAWHIALNDPAYVLADIVAKREIVAGPNGGTGPDHHDEWVETLRRLALPFASHPDYDEAWRPS